MLLNILPHFLLQNFFPIFLLYNLGVSYSPKNTVYTRLLYLSTLMEPHSDPVSATCVCEPTDFSLNPDLTLRLYLSLGQEQVTSSENLSFECHLIVV